MPENPDIMINRNHHIESSHQTIKYVGYNGLINTTTIDINGTRRDNEKLKTLTQVKQPFKVNPIRERMYLERNAIPVRRKLNERAFESKAIHQIRHSEFKTREWRMHRY